MAIVFSSTFGKISGKHGTAVTAIRKKDGMVILKEYRPAANPNTEGQKNQRAKFGFVMKELNCLRKLFSLTFDGQYGINKAVSMIMKTGVPGQYPDFVLDYTKLILSKGKLAPAFVSSFGFLNNMFEVEWDRTFTLEAQVNDRVNLVFLNPIEKSMVFRQAVAIRNDGKVLVELPENLFNSEVHAWFFFSSGNNSFSDSQYLGIINI